MRMVDPAEWDVAGVADVSRRDWLSHPPAAETLVMMVASEAAEAAATERASLIWQLGDEMKGCCRAIADKLLFINSRGAIVAATSSNGRSRSSLLGSVEL